MRYRKFFFSGMAVHAQMLRGEIPTHLVNPAVLDIPPCRLS
jgi:hypothetical protein